ncbi:NUDIX hydrolase [archaeon]|nr:NUDIX hydrolase [archaeon]NCQ50420.1 NUDIX hydrolase [archaeon]
MDKKLKTSCGIIIVNELNEIFMGHSTGNSFYDLPKGLLEDNELPIDCAIRECEEETSLVLNHESLIDLGSFKYNKEKDLHLFLTFKNKDSISLDALVCKSMFEHYLSKKLLPEVDGFKWIPISSIESKCAKSMAKLLTILINDNSLNINEYKNKSTLKI